MVRRLEHRNAIYYDYSLISYFEVSFNLKMYYRVTIMVRLTLSK